MEKRPFISRCWKCPITIALTTFIIVQCSMRWNQLQDNNLYCNIVNNYAKLSYYTNVFEVIGFSTILLVLIGIIISNKFKTKNHGSIFVVGFVAFLGGISSLMTIMWNWGGICEDALGVRSSGVIWGEWLSCIPLLFYTVIAIEVKSKLTSRDIGCLLNIILSMATSLAMQFQSSIIVDIFLLILSCIFLITSLILLMATDKNITTAVAADPSSTTLPAVGIHIENFFAKKKHELGLFLCCFITAFPIIYFLSLARILSHEATSVAYAISNILIKIFFASIIVNTYFEAFIVMGTIETITNPIRNSLLKYIMHEVRVPLNAITMGIGLLQNSRNLSGEEEDALLMMENASEFLTDTLSDLLDFQEMDNNSIHIANQPIQLRETLTNVRSSCDELIHEKSVHVTITVCEDVPNIIISDVDLFEQLLKILLCHSIKFSPAYSDINISVFKTIKNILSSKLTRTMSSICSNNELFLSIVIQDESPPLSEVAHKLLFQPYSQILPSELREGGGTGMSLSICKVIVNTLKGTITSNVTANSSGNMITVTLPVQFMKQDDKHAIQFLANPIPPSRHRARSSIIPSTNTCRLRGAKSSMERRVFELEPTVLNINSIYDSSAQVKHGNSKRVHNQYASYTTQKNYNSSSSSSSSSIASSCNNSNNQLSTFSFKDSFKGSPSSNNGNKSMLSLERGESLVSVSELNVTSSLKADSKPKLISSRSTFLLNALVVDDVASNRKLLSALLAIRNVQCMSADDGIMAVEVYRNNPGLFDLIFMDYSMPRMNGVEATKIIRQDGYSQLIIAVTGNVMDGDVTAFLNAGADLVVLKPMRPKQLDEILEMVRGKV